MKVFLMYEIFIFQKNKVTLRFYVKKKYEKEQQTSVLTVNITNLKTFEIHYS